MKSYIGIVRDHSTSMRPHAALALEDYKTLIEEIKTGAREHSIDTVVSVVKCGVGPQASVEKEIENSSIAALTIPSRYIADGHATPLWDSIGTLINMLEGVPDAGKQDVAFNCLFVTDGEENNSHNWTADRLRTKIRKLQATDRWSFVFRVPRGYALRLHQQLDIPSGNILEWDQTEHGWQEATMRTSSGMRGYYSGLKSGRLATNRFYADLDEVKVRDVKREMRDISKLVTIWNVPTSSVIRPFVEEMSGNPYIKGNAYYELVKSETVQFNKGLIVVNKNNGSAYEGHAARDLLGLPEYGDIRLVPGRTGDWTLFVQSTSVNRVLPANTKLLYRKRT